MCLHGGMNETLTGQTATLTGVPNGKGGFVTFTTKVLGTSFTFETVTAVDVEVPDRGRRTVGANYITEVAG
jgi:hypothetical protein